MADNTSIERAAPSLHPYGTPPLSVLTIGGDDFIVITSPHPMPNWFHRTMQWVLFGFKWSKFHG